MTFSTGAYREYYIGALPAHLRIPAKAHTAIRYDVSA